jgi:hypothetical protein
VDAAGATDRNCVTQAVREPGLTASPCTCSGTRIELQKERTDTRRAAGFAELVLRSANMQWRPAMPCAAESRR